jgi:hypothetical protein
MLYQVDDALLHAMSGIELSRVRTELRLLLPEAHQQEPTRGEGGPTLLCNHVVLGRLPYFTGEDLLDCVERTLSTSEDRVASYCGKFMRRRTA